MAEATPKDRAGGVVGAEEGVEVGVGEGEEERRILA